MARDTHLRKKYYRKLCERDGEKCRVCGQIPPMVYLEIDHKDGNKDHNPPDMSNFQLLCRTHNRKKNPRGKGRGEIEKRKLISLDNYNDLMDQSRMSPEMYTRNKCKPMFCHWLYQKVKKEGQITVHEAIYAGAKVAGCSSHTIRTSYLPEEASSEGLFRIVHDEEAKKNFVKLRDASVLGVDVDFEIIDEKND